MRLVWVKCPHLHDLSLDAIPVGCGIQPYSFLQGTDAKLVLEYLSQPPGPAQKFGIQYEANGHGPYSQQSRPPAGPQALTAEEQEDLLLGHHLVDFWTNLCVCHLLITEENEPGLPPVYQVS